MPPSGPSQLLHSVSATAESIPWRWILLDLVLVAAWVLALSVAFGTTDWPSWLYYVVVFGGVVAYSLAGSSRAIHERFAGFEWS